MVELVLDSDDEECLEDQCAELEEVCHPPPALASGSDIILQNNTPLSSHDTYARGDTIKPQKTITSATTEEPHIQKSSSRSRVVISIPLYDPATREQHESLPDHNNSSIDAGNTVSVESASSDIHNSPVPTSSSGREKRKRATSKVSKRKHEEDGGTDELASAGIMIGFPKDNYKPRASRSRTNKINSEIVENAQSSPTQKPTRKQSKKEHKVQRDQEHNPIVNEDIEYIIGLGFEAGVAEGALVEAQNDREKAVDMILNGWRPQTKAKEETAGDEEHKTLLDDGEASMEHLSKHNIESPALADPEVIVVGQPDKGAQQKLAMPENTAAMEPTVKKKRRGRPARVTQIAEDEVDLKMEEATQQDANPPSSGPSTVLQEKDVNIQSNARADCDDDKPSAEVQVSQPLPATATIRNSPPKTWTPSGPKLRVGLSKNARLPPLLRLMKK